MRRHPFAIVLACVVVVVFFVGRRLFAQAAEPSSRITVAIDNTKLAMLRGNVHPLARAEYDRGLAPDSLTMDHMLLVLQRSAAQQAALDKLLAEQQDKTSANYHKWLTPDEFGRQFGASDSDIQKISGWLQSQGFSVNSVAHGRDIIDFSGNAGSVRTAFHTEMHRYMVNNEEHWANASDPEIPAALAPVVAGIRSLNNFFPRAQHHAVSAQTRATEGRRPLYTYFPTGCSSASCAYFNLGPGDFAKIYNVPSSATGSGVTIAVVAASDICGTDITQFRSIFGLPPMTINEAPQGSPCSQPQPAAVSCVNGTPCFTLITPNTDPGVVGPNSNGGPDGDEDEVEAVLDAEWSGAVANMANIDLVSSADVGTTSAGIDLSATYVVDNVNTISPKPSILSESYGVCELDATASGNSFYNGMWSQAAAEGISVLVSAGDDGSAACDSENPNGPSTQPATGGLEVNAIASTPYDIAVGGTDFNDPSPLTYFSSSNSANGTSALGYVPEMTWNDTCTNSIVYQSFNFTTAEAACNSAAVQDDDNSDQIYFVAPVGGSGGVSSCTNPIGSTCSGGYPKPTWQVGTGVPLDGKRDLPDVSVLGADGLISGSSYIDCEADFPGQNNVPIGNCTLATGAFLGIGGTSASAQAFAGIMALIDQSAGSAQGNANPMFYALAAKQVAANCNSSNPASSCVFHDVTVGTNTMPCAKGSPNCSVTVSSDTIGVLATTVSGKPVNSYNAGTGYDLATGLGTPNVANLIGGWGANFYISAATPTASVSGPGSSGSMTLTVYGIAGFSGSVSGFACSGLPSGASCSFSCPTGVAACNSGSNGVSVTLSPQVTSANINVTVTTSSTGESAPIAQRSEPKHWDGTGIAVLLGALLSGIGILAVCGSGKAWKPALCLAAFAVVFIAGCGGGSKGGTPTGSTVVTLSALSGASTTSTTFTLNVQ